MVDTRLGEMQIVLPVGTKAVSYYEEEPRSTNVLPGAGITTQYCALEI